MEPEGSMPYSQGFSNDLEPNQPIARIDIHFFNIHSNKYIYIYIDVTGFKFYFLFIEIFSLDNRNRILEIIVSKQELWSLDYDDSHNMCSNLFNCYHENRNKRVYILPTNSDIVIKKIVDTFNKSMTHDIGTRRFDLLEGFINQEIAHTLWKWRVSQISDNMQFLFISFLETAISLVHLKLKHDKCIQFFAIVKLYSNCLKFQQKPQYKTLKKHVKTLVLKHQFKRLVVFFNNTA